MKKLIILFGCLIVLTCNAFAGSVLDEIKELWIYPSEYFITTDYNPDKNRDWQFGEIMNGFKWKVKNKQMFFMPDEYLLQWDYNPDKDRNWQCQEVTAGLKWNLK